MRSLRRAFVLFLATGPIVGCAEIAEPPPPPPAVSGLTVACTNSATPEIFLMGWELRVSPDPIKSGEPFTATLEGDAVFHEEFLDEAQNAFVGGVRETNLVDLNATVHVRSGATGDDVVLKLAPIPYVCSSGGRKPCDPDNDLPSVPGLRGNTDCEPQGAANSCGRFMLLPISTDCGPDGLCAGLGKQSQCDDNYFCITEGLTLPLQQDTGHYTADVQGNVLFGWDDQNTGATIEEEGPNKGTWNLPEADYYEPTGPVGFRATVFGAPGALECTMGVNCRDPDLGVGCRDSLSSRTPDSELISFPIQPEAP